eukprot:138928-Prymnesium_polylepis.3
MLSGFGSDDEEEGVVPPPPMLSGFGPDDDEEGGAPLAEEDRAPGKRKSDCQLSQSGAFKTSDFHLRADGGLLKVGEGSSPDHARPVELEVEAFEEATKTLEVRSIADLEMLEELGSGASGTVYKARHTASGTLVAVKCVTILEKAKRDQVVGELRIMMSHVLGARWLVTMHNAFYEDAKVYTVLEMMDGGSLEGAVKKHAAEGGLTDERRLARVAREVLGGLNYLHRQLHQVHRDLKPANVLLSRTGAVKISDFGISSQLENTNAFCETFVGTTCYMSPERLAGEQYSYTADVWAFGLIILELATGRYPYGEVGSYFQLLGHIMDEPAPTPPDGSFSREFTSLISLCLDKDPKMRPTAHDLLKHPWFRLHPPDTDEVPASALGASRSSGQNLEWSLNE